jgi:SOUL heme-binding protein.
MKFNNHMKKIMYIIILVIVAILFVWTAISYFLNRSVKTPEYTVIEKSKGYEIRLYKPYLTAQVEVSGTYDEAINQGFSILADYIFGNNTKQTGIAMTAPVTEAESEKIAMTAPVVETGDNKKRIISFVMPFEYTLETLPKPNNPEVKIVPQNARKVAVLSFSWFRNALRIAGKKQELSKLLEQDSIKPKGSPEYAGYNAPFTAPWLNRNEVMIEIE